MIVICEERVYTFLYYTNIEFLQNNIIAIPALIPSVEWAVHRVFASTWS